MIDGTGSDDCVLSPGYAVENVPRLASACEDSKLNFMSGDSTSSRDGMQTRTASRGGVYGRSQPRTTSRPTADLPRLHGSCTDRLSTGPEHGISGHPLAADKREIRPAKHAQSCGVDVIQTKLKQAERTGMLALCGLYIGDSVNDLLDSAVLDHVHVADLSNNMLHTLPHKIGIACSRLQVLVCTNNLLDQFNVPLEHFTKLTKLVLSRNCLRDLPASLAHLGCLKSLSLDHNRLGPQVRDIFGGALSASLEELDLAQNVLEELPPSLAELTKLFRLSLRGNKLTELPAHLARLQSLMHLNVADNQLSSIPDDILVLPRLVNFTIAGNPTDGGSFMEGTGLEQYMDSSLDIDVASETLLPCTQLSSLLCGVAPGRSATL